MFLYLADHKSVVGEQVEREILEEEEVLVELEKMVCYGLNIHTKHGKEVSSRMEAKAIPHIAIIKIDDEGKALIQSVLEGKDVTHESVLKELWFVIQNLEKVEEEKKEEEISELLA